MVVRTKGTEPQDAAPKHSRVEASVVLTPFSRHSAHLDLFAPSGMDAASPRRGHSQTSEALGVKRPQTSGAPRMGRPPTSAARCNERTSQGEVTERPRTTGSLPGPVAERRRHGRRWSVGRTTQGSRPKAGKRTTKPRSGAQESPYLVQTHRGQAKWASESREPSRRMRRQSTPAQKRTSSSPRSVVTALVRITALSAAWTPRRRA